MDRLGCCLGDCSGASDLASKSRGVTEGGNANFRTSAASFAIFLVERPRRLRSLTSILEGLIRYTPSPTDLASRDTRKNRKDSPRTLAISPRRNVGRRPKAARPLEPVRITRGRAARVERQATGRHRGCRWFTTAAPALRASFSKILERHCLRRAVRA